MHFWVFNLTWTKIVAKQNIPLHGDIIVFFRTSEYLNQFENYLNHRNWTNKQKKLKLFKNRINLLHQSMTNPLLVVYASFLMLYFQVTIIITWLSEICLTSLIVLFLNFPLFWNFPLLFSHSKNIWMSTLIAIIIIF